MRDGGKGDAPRPLVIPMEKYDENFEKIFGKKPPRPNHDFEPIPFAGMVYTGEDEDE